MGDEIMKKEMNLDRLLVLYRKLLSIIEKYGEEELNSQKSTVRDIVDFIGDIDYREKECENDFQVIKKMHESMFPPRGGLSNFFIWSNDYDERIRLNDPLDKVRKEIFEVLMDITE